jgi:hypothetical protein
MAFKFLPVIIENALLENEDVLRSLSSQGQPDMEDVLTLCRNFRIAGIGLLFFTGRPRDFLIHLSHSGRAFAHFLAHAAGKTPRLSKCAPFFDALAAGDLAAGADIARRSQRTWVRNEEYEEDFLFVDFLMQHFFLGASSQDCDDVLTRWEAALQGSEDVRLAICGALLEKKEDAFNEALDLYLDERRDELEEKARETRLADEEKATWQLCVEGLALMRLAEHIGMETEQDYLHIPLAARKRVKGLSFGPDAWRRFEVPELY